MIDVTMAICRCRHLIFRYKKHNSLHLRCSFRFCPHSLRALVFTYAMSEQYELFEQHEQFVQLKQLEQYEQFVQFLQFFKLSSALRAFSLEPKNSTEHLFPLLSSIHVFIYLAPCDLLWYIILLTLSVLWRPSFRFLWWRGLWIEPTNITIEFFP